MQTTRGGILQKIDFKCPNPTKAFNYFNAMATKPVLTFASFNREGQENDAKRRVRRGFGIRLIECHCID
jgi:hypothetical protein